MVFGQPVHMVIERMQCRSGQDAGLTHAATQHLAPASRAGNHLRRTDQHGPDRCAEALGQANGNRIETFCECGRCLPTGNRGIEDARSIQMRGQSLRTRP